MGNCAIKKSSKKQDEQKFISQHGGSQRFINIQSIQEKQINNLKLIYADLACRSKSRFLNSKNFQAFFHLNSVLGGLLFKKFQKSHRNQITQKEFIKNVLEALDLDQQKRVQYLFSAFVDCENHTLSYHELLAVFLSCPHQCMKQMVANDQFLDCLVFSQICTFILDSNQVTLSLGDAYTLTPAFRYRYIHETSNDQLKPMVKNYDLTQVTQSKLFTQSKENTIKVLKCKMSKQFYNSEIVISYVNYFFKKYKLNKDKDGIKLNIFKKIVRENQIFFSLFFNGFHEYLWRTQNSFPLYKTIFAGISDYCTEQIGGVTRQVYIALMKTSIMVFGCQKMQQPLAIKNLQGLHVKAVQGNQGEKGFTLFHFQGFYPETNYYFQDQSRQKQWLQSLKQFKVNKIQAKYKIKRKIGSGSTSEVHQYVDKSTNSNYAVKILKKSKETYKRYLQSQSQVLAMCAHENIVKVYERFQTNKYVYLIMEAINNQNLQQYTKSTLTKYLAQQQAKSIMKQLFSAVQSIHSRGFIHRDIKLQNILINNQNGKIIPKIIDFGSAIYKMQISTLDQQVKYIGSSPFIAPQVLHKVQYNQKIDEYSLGVIMYYLLIGKLPKVLQNKQIQFDFNSYQWQRINYKAKDLINKLTCKQSSQRISCREALQSKWFNK